MASTRQTAERYFRAIEKGNVEAAVELVAPGAEFTNPLGAVPVPDGVRAMLTGYVAAFPDHRFEVKHALESGEDVALEGDYVGTHTGPLALPDGQSVAPTGRTVRAPFVTVFRVRDGRILSHRSYWDLAGFLGQLGLGQ